MFVDLMWFFLLKYVTLDSIKITYTFNTNIVKTSIVLEHFSVTWQHGNDCVIVADVLWLYLKSFEKSNTVVGKHISYVV